MFGNINSLKFFTCCFHGYEELNEDPMKESKIDNTIRLNPATELPTEVFLEVLSYLTVQDLSRCYLVNKEWKQLAADQSFQPLWSKFFIEKFAIGKKAWEEHIGNVGNEPPLPLEIYDILKKKFFGTKVSDCLIALMPETVNGEALTLIKFKELIKAKKDVTEGIIISENIAKEHGNEIPEKSYWVVMTNENATLDKTKLPKIREAVFCIFMKFLHSKKKEFSRPWFMPISGWTRCLEKVTVNRQTRRLIVGDFTDNLNVFYRYDPRLGSSDIMGRAASQRFVSAE